MQFGRRIISKLLQKMTETASGLVKLFRLLHKLIALGIWNKIIASPRLSLAVLEIIGAALRLDICKRLPVRISTLTADYISQILGNAENIFHDSRRILEYITVDPLEHVG